MNPLEEMRRLAQGLIEWGNQITRQYGMAKDLWVVKVGEPSRRTTEYDLQPSGQAAKEDRVQLIEAEYWRDSFTTKRFNKLVRALAKDTGADLGPS